MLDILTYSGAHMLQEPLQGRDVAYLERNDVPNEPSLLSAREEGTFQTRPNCLLPLYLTCYSAYDLWTFCPFPTRSEMPCHPGKIEGTLSVFGLCCTQTSTNSRPRWPPSFQVLEAG